MRQNTCCCPAGSFHHCPTAFSFHLTLRGTCRQTHTLEHTSICVC